MPAVSIAHLVSPVPEWERSDLAAAQLLTFESLRRARRRVGGAARVELVAASLDAQTPAGFAAAPLQRSVLDCASFRVGRRLPLLGDLLARLRGRDARLCVFSNVDIAVSDGFYQRVLELRDGGLRAFSINRRTVPGPPDADLDWLLAQPGEAHPGHDCFVFPPEALEGIDFGGLCVGVPPVGAALLAALSTRVPDFRVLTDESVTFHLGDERPWRDSRLEDYWDHNRRAAREILSWLEAHEGALSPLAEVMKRRELDIVSLMDF